MGYKITFKMEGRKRKELAQAISEIVNTTSIYKGVPSCAYEIAGVILDREGSIVLNESMAQDETEDLVSKL